MIRIVKEKLKNAGERKNNNTLNERPYSLRVVVGYGVSQYGVRYDICKVEQVTNKDVLQPHCHYDRSGYYHKSLYALLRDDYLNNWQDTCHLIIYQPDDFTFARGVKYD